MIVNLYTWMPVFRWFQRLSVFITLVCCSYMVFFLIAPGHDNPVVINADVIPMNNMGRADDAQMLSLNPIDDGKSAPSRDIFSLTTQVSGAAENTPKGQLPSNLKIVGILIAHPSQIIIEDSNVNKTYFLNEGEEKDGIKVLRVEKDQAVINFQGQDIPVSINKY